MMNDIALELAKLHILEGADFIRQLRLVVSFKEFQPVAGESNIFSAIGQDSDDYQALLNAARKAVAHGYRVYILPNPKSIRTADFIFERKGILKMYDVKTIQGQHSVFNRLVESIGQTNHVILNLATDYDGRVLASEIKTYFEINSCALEVLIFKGRKLITIDRDFIRSPQYHRLFRKRFEK